MTKKFNSYLGKAGHLYVMSEFLMLGWNVAIPEVDIGDDIFVVQDSNGALRRVQVKTANSKNRKDGYSGVFNISVKNLLSVIRSDVYYIFVIRHQDRWLKPVVLRQDYLANYVQEQNIGTRHKNYIMLYFAYTDDRVFCSGKDFTDYVGNFGDFPVIEH